MEELSNTEIRRIIEKIKEQYDVDEEILRILEKEFRWFKNKEGKIFLVKKELVPLLKEIKYHRFGLYFARIEKGEKIRLSIEGSQIIGPFAKKKIVEIDYQELKKWLAGSDLERKEEDFVIIKSDSYFAGSGLAKNGKIKNYIPKERRITL